MELLDNKRASADDNRNVIVPKNECKDITNEHLQNGDSTKKLKTLNIKYKNMVGVNFKSNPSLCSRYSTYLSSNPLTDQTDLFVSTENLVFVSTASRGSTCSLLTLRGLSKRVGFANSCGRLFAAKCISNSLEDFLLALPSSLPKNSQIRTHAHPQKFASKLLDLIEENEEVKDRNVSLSPTSPSHLLVAVELDSQIAWGVFTAEEYRESIARPGDGERSPGLDTGVCKAEAKMKEALQLLSREEEDRLFGEEGVLAVDVGAAPGGWTGHLANIKHTKVGVIAIDPATLSPSVSCLDNVVHLRHKAEQVSANDGQILRQVAQSLAGDNWKDKLRLLTCDANLDIRDSLRELVLPFLPFLQPGGVAVVTVKLGRRVGVAGVDRKCDVTRQLLVEFGFREESIRFHWLFSNSKNERTVIAVKK